MENINKKNNIWFSERIFPIFTALLSAGVFAGTHMYYIYHIGAFNEIAIVAMLQAGIAGGSFGAAAAFGASFLFARILEGPLVGILDIGGSIMTGVGIGIPAILLSMGITGPIVSFPLALLTGGVIGLVIGCIIILIRKYTVASSNSTFGAAIFYAWKKPIAGGAIIGAMLMGALFPIIIK
ncbi:DUF4310 family protein [Pectinatus frisingensis]|uniref:DUF4310 family protein n=1 Tax=Pectinatus frisingensis TaxID=865 RepID=UPI003D805A50